MRTNPPWFCVKRLDAYSLLLRMVAWCFMMVKLVAVQSWLCDVESSKAEHNAYSTFSDMFPTNHCMEVNEFITYGNQQQLQQQPRKLCGQYHEQCMRQPPHGQNFGGSCYLLIAAV